MYWKITIFFYNVLTLFTSFILSSFLHRLRDKVSRKGANFKISGISVIFTRKSNLPVDGNCGGDDTIEEHSSSGFTL